MGKKDKKKDHGFRHALTAGFDAIKVLDNTNIYGVLFSETFANVFISGMWMKILNPYTLVVSQGDKVCVGNNITIAGLTRAVVGVFAGQFLIDKLGCDSAFAVTGVFGVMGIVINIWCLMHTSLQSIYILNFVWAVFNGLWNSCLETEWARSILKQKREDVNDARQVMNKMTTACGPLISIALFLYVGGTGWTIPVLTFVMVCGTIGSILPVLLCFNFSRVHEVRQVCSLYEIREIEFTPDLKYSIAELTKEDFQKKPGGPVRITYPLNGKSKFGKLRVLTPDLKETPYILGKSVQCTFQGKHNIPEGEQFDGDLIDIENKISKFLESNEVSEYAAGKLQDCHPVVQAKVLAGGNLKDVDASDDLVKRVKEYWKVPKLQTSSNGMALFQPCILHFVDLSREPLQAEIENIVIYLKNDRSVNEGVSSMTFHLCPALEGPQAEKTHKYWFWIRGFRKIFLSKISDFGNVRQNLEGAVEACKSLPSRANLVAAEEVGALSTPLLQVSDTTIAVSDSPSGVSIRSKEKEYEPPGINMTFANVIVFCDVMNAVGSGMSLKFMDLFLMTDYQVMPVTLFVIAIVQSLAVVWLTPVIKMCIRNFQHRGWNGGILVSVVWLLSALSLILIIIPDQYFSVVLVAIILMNSLSSCTKAYNRAQLVNALPHNRVANYMVWDSLNKANQGGIAIAGGQVAAMYGYRGCFMCTFVILIIRWVVWTGYIVYRARQEKAREMDGQYRPIKKTRTMMTAMWETFDDTEANPSSEVGSELFPAALPEEKDDAAGDTIQVLGTVMETEGEELMADADQGPRFRGGRSSSKPETGNQHTFGDDDFKPTKSQSYG